MNEIVLNSNIGGIHGITWVYPADFSFEAPGIKAQTKDLYLEMPISFMKPWVTLAISRPRSRSKHRDGNIVPPPKRNRTDMYYNFRYLKIDILHI